MEYYFKNIELEQPDIGSLIRIKKASGEELIAVRCPCLEVGCDKYYTYGIDESIRHEILEWRYTSKMMENEFKALKTSYLREIIDEVETENVKKVIVMKGATTGSSTTGIIATGKYIHSFDRIIFSNRWKLRSYSRPCDWTIIGLRKQWFSTLEYEYQVCFFGLMVRVWYKREFILIK